MSQLEMWAAIVGIAVIIGLIFLVLGAAVGGYEHDRDRAADRDEEERLLTNRRMSQ